MYALYSAFQLQTQKLIGQNFKLLGQKIGCPSNNVSYITLYKYVLSFSRDYLQM